MKYSLLMPYIHRPKQLQNTLLSYRYWYKERNDFEIIIIEDQKNTPEQYQEYLDVISLFQDLDIKRKVCNTVTYNPSPHYNIGADSAKGEYIIITNPECMHLNNILAGLDNLDTDNTYIVCACRNLMAINSNPRTFSSIKYIKKRGMIEWYQHSVHRNLQYHFCSCISKKNYRKIGGFDERYINGMGYDDLDLITTIRNSDMGIISNDKLIVVHQYHQWVKSEIEVKKLTTINSIVFAKKWPGLKYDT